jgi:hypothetical protein
MLLPRKSSKLSREDSHELKDELQFLEYNDYFFFRQSSITTGLIAAALYTTQNFDRHLGAAVTILLLVWQTMSVVLSVCEYRVDGDLLMVLSLRRGQFWFYRLLTLVLVGLFFWCVSIMLSK